MSNAFAVRNQPRFRPQPCATGRQPFKRNCGVLWGLLFLLFSSEKVAFGQRQYIDLEPVNNPLGKPGWKCMLRDEFNGSKRAMWLNGFMWGNSHPQNLAYNRDANYEYAPTFLRLVTKQEQYAPPGYHVIKEYTSAMLNSDSIDDTYEFTFGFFEARCRVPRGQRLFPAFWLYGENEFELDVAEIEGDSSKVYLTNHYRAPSGHVANASEVYAMPGQHFSDDWVTFALKWEPNKLVWYINNKRVRVTTNQTDIIPRTKMRVKFQVTVDPPRGHRVPPTFPNNCDIDYIRVYKRLNESNGDPVFSINGQSGSTPAAPISVSFSGMIGGKPIVLDAIESYMPFHKYHLGVQQCTSSGDLVGNAAATWLTSAEVAQIDAFDLVSFCQRMGLPLTVGNTYQIRLKGALSGTRFEYMMPVPCANNVDFTINGTDGYHRWATYDHGKPGIILDGSKTTSCNGWHFVSVQECTSEGEGFGPEISRWFSPAQSSEIGNLDLRMFCGTQLPMEYGSHYRVKLAVGDPWDERASVLHIEPCDTEINFSINGHSDRFPAPILIVDGEEIRLDGSNSRSCDSESRFFVSVQECDASGLVSMGPEIMEWRLNPNIGCYDIRDFCFRNNFSLRCGRYYRVKLAGSPWRSDDKIIHIVPCAVNSTFEILIDGQPYTGQPLPDPEQIDIRLYAPTSVSPNRTFALYVQQWVNGLPAGRQAGAYLTLEEVFQLQQLGYFNIEEFAKSYGVVFVHGATYRITLFADPGICPTSSPIVHYEYIVFSN